MDLMMEVATAETPTENHASLATPITSDERFTRIEEKFFLPQNLREKFLNLVVQHLPASYPDQATQYTLIESIYFDSNDLRSFRDHFDQLPYRFKMRSRRYGPNGTWEKNEDSTVFIELKTKQDGISDKFRTKINPDELIDLVNGGRITSPTTKKAKAAMKINEIMDQASLSPSAKIIYRRFAFEKDAIRLTVDDQVQFSTEINIDSHLSGSMTSQKWWSQADKMSTDIFKAGMSLVELKHFGITPQWLIEFMREENLQFTNFSKYCYSMANLLKKSEAQ